VALTSVSEGLPLTVLESMACGIPNVCTRVGACEDLLNGVEGEDAKLGISGLIAPVGDHRGIGRAIVRILERPELAEAMSQASRERVRRFYDLKVIVKRYRDLYDEWFAKGKVN
jgi:glycosyltransferase involved in cell wall biosynthesis